MYSNGPRDPVHLINHLVEGYCANFFRVQFSSVFFRRSGPVQRFLRPFLKPGSGLWTWTRSDKSRVQTILIKGHGARCSDQFFRRVETVSVDEKASVSEIGKAGGVVSFVSS